jgi:2-polyprenyl-3-methyl-5-hydroxy-6-metoxy-1,4-benzoquinol methylase
VAHRTESAIASETAVRLYSSAPFLVRWQQRLRPTVCPFDELTPEIRATGGRLLDYGCGAGLFGLHCLSQGYVDAVDGVDLDPSAIASAEAARLASPHSAAVRFGVGEPPETSYDAISMIDVMHHVAPADQQATFLDLCNRLAPGGVLVYKDMCRRPRWRALANRLHDLVLNRQWIHYVPIEQVIDWAVTRGGLILERRTRFNYFVYGHELAVFRHAG